MAPGPTLTSSEADLRQATQLVYEPEYYQTVYGNYDAQNPPYKYRHYLQTLEQFHPLPFPLLDFGCANGRFLKHLCHQGNVLVERLYGTDVNAAAIAQAQPLFPEGNILLGGRAALTEFDQTFQAITALDVLEHLPDLDETLAQLSDCLAPQGILLAVVPVYDGPLGPLVHLLDKDPTHIHKKSRQFWVNKLSEQFTVLHWHGILRYLMPGGVYLHWPTRMARAITPAVLLVAQKRA